MRKNLQGLKNSYLKQVLGLLAVTLLLEGFPIPSFSQSLDNIKNEKPVKVNGSFSATGVAYQGKSGSYQRLPFTYFLNGNINISLYGVAIPLSMNYSNQQLSFSQPFNQYGISPTYKWITIHAGYRSMNFSSYTLAGHTFLGGGVELMPSIFRIAAMYGRLSKAIAYDSARQEPTYERWGYGLKLGVGKNSDFVDLIFFKAHDLATSLSLGSQLGVLPQENLVTAIVASKKIMEHLLISGEYATSAYTRNTTADKNEEDQARLWNYLPGIYQPNSSSIYRHAFKTNLTYGASAYSIQASYERIDPDYQTMGAYFFNNDLENSTLGGGVQLFNGRVQLGSQVGVQRNNLSESRASVQRRFISSFTVSGTITSVWMVSASYSNFNMSAQRAPQLNPLAIQTDTLNLHFVQVNQNAGFSSTYQLSKGERQCSILLNGSYQVSTDRQGSTELTQSRSTIYTASVGSTYKASKTAPSFTLMLNMNQNKIGELQTRWLGPSVSVSKAWMNNTLRASGSTSYNQTWVDEQGAGVALMFRLNGTYILAKEHTFTLSLNAISRTGNSSSMNTKEYITTINYGYTF